MAPIHERSSYTVSYNSESHLSVIFQLWGSQWPKVLPWCLFNVFIMVILIAIEKKTAQSISLEISPQGHSFITMVVAFLLVSRVNMGLARYGMARGYIGTMYKETREVVQHVCVFSMHDKSSSAWRHECAYRALVLLRSAMAVIDYPTYMVASWDIPELNGDELTDVRNSIYLSPNNRRWAHGERTVWEETMRVPIRLAYLLRKSIHNQSKFVNEPIQLGQENKLFANVDGFMGGFYGIRKFLTTPVPFPLVQMARTFLFLYVFTVPFVMLADSSSNLAHCFMVFLLTYGFVGLEVVAIELDNPFGDDDNDFNNSKLAETAYEDVYLSILDIDGPEWTDKLRKRMYNPKESETSVPNERSWLLGGTPGVSV